MKVTKRYIKKLVKEELTVVLKEMDDMRRAQRRYDAMQSPDSYGERPDMPELEELWDEEILDQDSFSEFAYSESDGKIDYEAGSLTFDQLSPELKQMAQRYYDEQGEEDFENHLAR